MLLQRTNAHVESALDLEEARLREHRFVLTEVRDVLNEMVYDVETCAHECEVAQLKRDLEQSQCAVREHEQRERDLIHERQQHACQAYELAAQVEAQGRATVNRFTDHISVVYLELTKKDVLEKELAEAREQIAVTAQLSKDLASAQRDIRELRRQHSIQRLLRGTPSSSYTTSENSRSNGPLIESPVVAPASPTSTSSRSSTSSRTSSPATATNNQSVVTVPLVRCPDAQLMLVFAFLDANSVFAVSLTNHALLARVHMLFGMATPATTRRGATALPVVVPQQQQQQQVSPRPRSMPSKGRSQSVVTTTEKERAQLSKVDRIVKSLKKDEIKLFHEMSTRIRTLETHLGQVQAEKEDVAARLHGAENVRDFVLDKLKDLEDALATTLETSAHKDEQALRDREIIGFLDAKSHEHELALRAYAAQNSELRLALARQQEEHSAKIAIIHDMVQLLNQEKQELELQLRSQRKVLVREVKGLRAQSQELLAEKEQYFAQLQQLKHALRHLDAL